MRLQAGIGAFLFLIASCLVAADGNRAFRTIYLSKNSKPVAREAVPQAPQPLPTNTPTPRPVPTPQPAPVEKKTPAPVKPSPGTEEIESFAAPVPPPPPLEPVSPVQTEAPDGAEMIGESVGGEVVNPFLDENMGDSDAAALLERAGIFEKSPYSFALSVREGYDDNLFTTATNRYGSFYTNLAGGIARKAGGGRFRLEADVNGGATWYYTRPGNKVDYTGQASLSGLWEAAPNLQISFYSLTAYLAQPDLTIAGGTNRQNGDYLYSANDIVAARTWTERFSTQTKYNFTPFVFVEQALNNSQGRIAQTLGQSFLWLVKPKTAGVLEYRANPVDYFTAPLDNFGQYFLLGVDQTFNPCFTVTGRAGAELRFYNQDNNNPDYFGPYGELQGAYAYGKSSTALLNLRYGTEASGLNGAATRQTLRIGFSAVHGLTARLALTLGLNYQNNFYNEFDKPVTNPDFYENIFEFSAGVNFNFSETAFLQIGYQRTVDMAPASEQLSYTRNVAYAGINLKF
ncbi:MAG: hypothetical protein ACOYNG_07920 [Terrimicrobiaceae bacterium]